MTGPRIAKDGEVIAASVAMTDAEGAIRFIAPIDASPLTGVQRHRDGYVNGRVLAARVGVQEYHATEMGLVEDRIIRVYRPEEEVMRLDSLGSYKGKPITDGHPGERVTAENWGSLARGTVMGVLRDGGSVALDVSVTAKSLIEKLESGEARELSAGYVASIDWTPGLTPDGQAYDAIQRDIYIDHLAVVPRGRAGPEFRIGDDAKPWGAAPITHRADQKEAAMPDALKTMVVDGVSIQVTDQAAEVITKLTDQAAKMTADHEQAIKAKDGEIADLQKKVETRDGELAVVKKSLADATSPKALNDAAKKRADVVDAGKKAGLDAAAMETMGDADIRRAVVAKHLGDAVAKDMSEAAIDGAFAVAVQGNAGGAGDTKLGDGIAQTQEDAWAFLRDEKKEA